MTQPVFRFAPSPNGRLHLGHAYSALLNQHRAQSLSGRLLLRIEDTDLTRCSQELADCVVEDLLWLGIRWEQPVRVQSQHFSDYHAALQTLWNMHAIYPCFCSRKTATKQALRSIDPDGQPHYAGTCRHVARHDAECRMAQGEIFGWRLKTEESMAAHWGDAMIAKPRVGSSYHIAVVVDDALQGITHVVRGRDMEAATPLHLLLQQRLALPTPQYEHHALLHDDAGQKLSKSLRSQSLAELRRNGETPESLRARLGFPST